MTLTAIVGGTVIDGTGTPPMRDAVLLVTDDRVQSVSRAADTVVPEGARIIDATGRYVIPGLIDANAHLSTWMPDVLLRHEGEYAALVEEAAQVTLRSGLTTLFDTHGHLESLVTVRDRINAGDATGSRVFAAGNIIGLDGPFSADYFTAGGLLGLDTMKRINSQFENGVGSDLLRLTPDGVRRRVRDYIERSRIDFVKYASSGHGRQRHLIAFSELTQRAIIEEAHRAGMTAQAHSTTVESLRIAIEAGTDIFQHGNLTSDTALPEETLQTIVDRSLPVAALVYTDKQHAWVRENGSEWIRTFIINETTDQNNRRLIEAGARLLLTTDGFALGHHAVNHPLMAGLLACAPPVYVLGESHFVWLEAVVERGMAPMDALQAATRNVAEAYGHAADFGTLEPGKRADLLILDADPLADVSNCRRIVEVMKDGALVDRAALPTRRILSDG
jgi:imidazolonepropionase-like amidohydrolase